MRGINNTEENSKRPSEINEIEENLIIGIFNKNTQGTVFSELVAEDFEDGGASDVFRVAKGLFDVGAEIEPVAVFAKLKEIGYSGETTRDTLDHYAKRAIFASGTNFDYFISYLQDRSRSKRIQTLAERLTFAASLEEAEQLIGELALLSAPRGTAEKTTLGDMANFVADKINEDIEHPETANKKFIDWGVHPLDASLCTVKGNYVVIGGRPAVGKTMFALQIAVHMALSGLRVGFFSLEMTEEELAYRATAYLSGVEMTKIRNGHTLAEAEHRKLATAFGVMHKGNLSFFSKSRTAEQIRARTLSEQFDVIFCDYLQIIEGGKGATERERIGGISSALRSLAHNNNVLTIVLSQLSRPLKGMENKPPALSDLKESGSIEADANAVILLSLKKENDKQSDRYVQIAKNRSGPCSDFCLSFDGARQTFRYIQKKE